ncbi:hypothetical protein EVA_12337 [gut metagenome]|uniref:DUF3843 family protein n=1 Tax=gut metagenome TaxID=749906 RepID=J9CHL8_9ZZZZ
MKTPKLYMNQWLQLNGRRRTTDSDTWYLSVAGQFLDLLLPHCAAPLQALQPEKTALQLACYFQDAIAQQGGWKYFTNRYHTLYGRPLPFYTLTDHYVPDEINREDVGYLLWANASPATQPLACSPFDESLTALSLDIYQLMDELFEEAPISDVSSTNLWVPGSTALLTTRRPLPHITPQSKLTNDVKRCLAYTQGYPLVYLSTYTDLYRFLTEVLQWEAHPDGLLTDLKDESDFVIYANAKGMLIAPGVAAAFCDAHNPLYQADAAREWGYRLFTEPGACPFDLLKYAMEQNLLPEAALPFAEGKELLHRNGDFLARYYLGDYYEGD